MGIGGLSRHQLTFPIRKTFMRRSIVSLFSFLAIALIALTGCQEPQNSVPGSVDSISVRVMDSTDAKTITPDGNVNISHYVITVVNEAEGINQSSGYLTKGSMFTVSNVPAGEWYAKVDAYIDRGEDNYIKVASDQSEPQAVQAGTSTTFTLVLDTLDAVNSGDVEVILTMPSEFSAEDRFWYQYTITGLTNEMFSYQSDLRQGRVGEGGLVVLRLDSDVIGLVQGAYRFEITVQDAETDPALARKGVDVMRLVSGLTAKGSIDLSHDEEEFYEFDIEITDGVGNLLLPSLEDRQEVYELDINEGEETVSFSVTLSEPLSKTEAIEWYIDGELKDDVTTMAGHPGRYKLTFSQTDKYVDSYTVTAIVLDTSKQMSVGSITPFLVRIKNRNSGVFTEQVFTFGRLSNTDKTYEVTGLARPKGDFVMPENGVLTIPSSYKGEAVVSIEGKAFYDRTDIVGTVIIPEGIKTIEDSSSYPWGGAFGSCVGITEIQLPSTLSTIGEVAFYGCSGLSSITIPDNVTSIRDHAFEGCTGLTSIDIPEGISKISNSAFRNCTKLSEVRLPDSLTEIASDAFANCAMTAIDLPDSLKTLGGGAFLSSKIVNIFIPAGVETISQTCFRFSDLENIYCAVSSRPEGWHEDFHVPVPAGYSNPRSAEVFWGVSRSEYDAIMDNDSVPYTVPDPAISVDAGNATITCDKAFAHIYYTTDGTDPSKDSGTLYEAPFAVESSQTVKAVAYVGNDIYSEVAEYAVQ